MGVSRSESRALTMGRHSIEATKTSQYANSERYETGAKDKRKTYETEVEYIRVRHVGQVPKSKTPFGFCAALDARSGREMEEMLTNNRRYHKT